MVFTLLTFVLIELVPGPSRETGTYDSPQPWRYSPTRYKVTLHHIFISSCVPVWDIIKCRLDSCHKTHIPACFITVQQMLFYCRCIQQESTFTDILYRILENHQITPQWNMNLTDFLLPSRTVDCLTIVLSAGVIDPLVARVSDFSNVLPRSWFGAFFFTDWGGLSHVGDLLMDWTSGYYNTHDHR